MAKPTIYDVIGRLEALAQKRLMIGVADGRNAEIALYHELGTSRVPARPFLVPGLEEFVALNEDAIKAMAQKVIEGQDVNVSLGRLGLGAAAYVKKYITMTSPSGSPHGWKPLAHSTVQAKGSDKILIDTGELVGAITHKLENA
jgi:hypothetical protein